MSRAALALTLALALALPACRKAPPPPAASPDGSAAGAAGTRYIIGGDSRQDTSHVIPWAFHEAKARGVAAFFYLGDMELTPDLDEHFRGELAQLVPVEFLPVLGNHESIRRGKGVTPPAEARVQALTTYTARFMSTPATPVRSAFQDKLAYAVDLPGGVHFVALDNVTQSGFGADQMAWLTADLDRAHANPAVRHIVVGMHKALVGNGVTTHAMEEDGPGAAADSEAALALFEKDHVELIVASHWHGLAEYKQRGIRSFITGGLGAPLDKNPGKEPGFHHLLVATVPAEGPLAIEVVRFPGPASYATEDER